MGFYLGRVWCLQSRRGCWSGCCSRWSTAESPCCSSAAPYSNLWSEPWQECWLLGRAAHHAAAHTYIENISALLHICIMYTCSCILLVRRTLLGIVPWPILPRWGSSGCIAEYPNGLGGASSSLIFSTDSLLRCRVLAKDGSQEFDLAQSWGGRGKN